MDEEPGVGIYRLHVWLRQISPMIWRRLLVRSDSTITDLHHILQIAFGWSDEHLNRFHIHDGGIGFSTDPEHVRLGGFRFRVNEQFLYEYHFNEGWEHQVRVEARLGLEDKRIYPCCIGGKRRVAPEDCGGPYAFMTCRDEVPLQVEELIEDVRDDLEANDLESIRNRVGHMDKLRKWLTSDSFDRRAVNRQLKQYATHGEA